MRTILIYVVLFFFVAQPILLTAQTKADSISLIFPKAVIVNKKNEVLLAYDANRKAYEVPSIGTLQGPVSIKQYLDKTAAEIGVTFQRFRLGGMFSYIFPDKYRTFVRPYFVVEVTGYVNGKGVADTTCKWFPREQAIRLIPYPASALIVRQVLTQPQKVWAASFEEYGYTNPVDTSKIRFKQLESFYPMN
ncbi:hypothetical protein SAMN05421788_106381 [Filimonas lacunae]|uniref:Uncharacterized protein n=1 Tax=Filimonas lacunae TaxID=477680 RepID=A0A173MFV6_9BACT|nr:NUDIX hydrolase [Filimonas lacunae]BAV06318.1 hypothetical protein FLA_2334 [Filimonas lacunae]SIT25784.1 hypothetical protein SAMN05421788_106381 [Filimonas lacunae]